MRRNESAAAQLQRLDQLGWDSPVSAMPRLKRNNSENTLSDLGRRERDLANSQENRTVVIEALVLELRELSRKGGTDRLVAAAKPMHAYIETIVKQLDLPNSCIVAVLKYVERAAAQERFELTELNWQPCVLSAFVIAAKLSFDEPVWNEDFVKALRISNVTVAQISRWEVSFLQLIDFNTNIEIHEYAKLCFRLQQRYHTLRGEKVQFFSFLMLQAEEIEKSRPTPNAKVSPAG